MSRVTIDIPNHFLFRTEIPVRITDINYGGHLGNDAVLSILHEARVRFLRLYGYSEMDIEGVGIILVDAAILYRSESFYGDVLVVEVCVDGIQSRGCDFVYRVSHKETGKEVVRAKTGVAFFDYGRRRIVGVPDRFRNVVSVAGRTP